jgi:hypothetical protein
MPPEAPEEVFMFFEERAAGPFELQKNNLLRFLVYHTTVWSAESERLFHLRFIGHG